MTRTRRPAPGPLGRFLLPAYAVGFAEGTCAHVLDLIRGGIHVYAGMAAVIQVLFLGLTVLDPLVVVLLFRRRTRSSGVVLAAVVMALDVTANWITCWPVVRADPGWLLRPVGLLPITLFGLLVLATAVPLLRERREPAGRPVR
ncbi:hypothetical protein [Streptomyces sp. RFCAC02]|uniref:hypothetical protein n=1 Tax=Streptomyces sp. RFCAC02 TaxID=2499143 RepID=UPI0010213EF8|nr:hypothetical protein [Streptomyces sp. RFCAC02]